MSGVVAIVRFDDSPAEIQLVERLLDRVPHRATDGRAVLSSSHCALGFARHATTARERAALQPLNDSLRALWIVADARLDNREELRETLQGRGGPDLTDPELLLLGYERWGERLAEHLVGDFAFVIWNSRRRELYAARDPFGSRPLFYHASSRRLVLASEVEQILTVDGVPWDLDDEVVLEYLLNRPYRYLRKTFFRDVRSIAPGHFLTARAGTLRETRYWRPPTEELRLSRPEEYHEEFRRLFRLAIDARLEADRPIVAQLSGGIDSSSIVCMANDIYRHDGVGRPPLRLVSGVYPGLPCDETPYIEAVASSVQFPSERYKATVWDPADEERFHVFHPWREAQPGTSFGWRRIALREGARVVLSGTGGDEVLWERGAFADLAARGRLRALLRETELVAGRFTRWQMYALKDAVREASPTALRSLYRRLRPLPAEPPPAWLGPRLQKVWSQPEDDPFPAAWASHTQKWTWRWTSTPHLYWGMDVMGYWMARRGVEMRFPFLDARLVRFVLSVPFEHRLPGGWRKRLLRRAMGDLLPPEVAGRRRITPFNAVTERFLEQHLPKHQHVLAGNTWASAPYVSRQGIQQLLDDVTAGRTGTWGSPSGRSAWNVLMFEQWLRDLESVRSVASPSGLSRAVLAG